MSTNTHIQIINRYYAKVYRYYDLTRKYYLFGRDAMLTEIAARQPASILEVGCGTGRNLAVLRTHLPNARFGAVEPCDSMRAYACRRYPWIAMCHDLAENADLKGILAHAPDIIFFSYSLSMIQEPERTVTNCLNALSPGGRVYIVDFGDLRGLGRIGQRVLRSWLRRFHTHPETLTPIFAHADVVVDGPCAYWKRAIFFR